MASIFNLSLHRTGTQSAHDLFRRAGSSSIHWPALIGDIDYQAKIEGRETDLDFVAGVLRPVFTATDHVCDLPVPGLYRQLAKQFPDARFIALRRSPLRWLSSVRRHMGLRPFEPFERVVYWRYFKDRPAALEDISDEDLVEFYDWHYRSLSEFFAGAENFLLLRLESRGLGAAICKFCGLPPVPFRQFDYAVGHDMGMDPELVLARITE